MLHSVRGLGVVVGDGKEAVDFTKIADPIFKAYVKRVLGLPFMRLPGMPEKHKVVRRLADGTRVDVDVVEMTWNDMLVIDAYRGTGAYGVAEGKYVDADCSEAEADSRTRRTAEIFRIAEELYETPRAEAVKLWLELPKQPVMEWPGLREGGAS